MSAMLSASFLVGAEPSAPTAYSDGGNAYACAMAAKNISTQMANSCSPVATSAAS